MGFRAWTPDEVKEHVIKNRGRDRRRTPPFGEESAAVRRRRSLPKPRRILTPEELKRRRARNLEAVRRYRLRHPAVRPRGRPRKQTPPNGILGALDLTPEQIAARQENPDA